MKKAPTTHALIFFLSVKTAKKTSRVKKIATAIPIPGVSLVEDTTEREKLVAIRLISGTVTNIHNPDKIKQKLDMNAINTLYCLSMFFFFLQYHV